MNVKVNSFIMESSFQFATMNSLTKNDKIQSKACEFIQKTWKNTYKIL